MHIAGKTGLAALAALAAATGVQAKVGMPDGDWRTIDRDLAQTRYSPLKQIDRANVGKLATAWSYTMKGANTASPLVIGGVMYLPAGARVVALDADTGKEIWSHTEARDPALAQGCAERLAQTLR